MIPRLILASVAPLCGPLPLRPRHLDGSHDFSLVFRANGQRSPMPAGKMMPAPMKLSAAVGDPVVWRGWPAVHRAGWVTIVRRAASL